MFGSDYLRGMKGPLDGMLLAAALVDDSKRARKEKYDTSCLHIKL
jgi:hypothetical protein